jgi:hypothetical protein
MQGKPTRQETNPNYVWRLSQRNLENETLETQICVTRFLLTNREFSVTRMAANFSIGGNTLGMARISQNGFSITFQFYCDW